MNRLAFRSAAWFAVSWGAPLGCAPADVDFDRPGLFACQSEDGVPLCEDDGVCSAGRCYAPEDQPRIEIVSPEIPAFSRYEPGAAEIPVNLRLVSNATLEEDSRDSGPRGTIEVSVDGVVVAMLDGGDVSAGVDVPTTLANTVGIHRISATMLQLDGEPYDNDAAFARLAYFVVAEDEPYIAITRPWPGETFSTDTAEIDVEVQAFNFAIVPAGLSATQARGHAHIHYGDDIGTCFLERACDAGPISIVDQALDNGVGRGPGLLPSGDSASVTLSAILRNVDHGPYLLPFEECNVVDPPPTCGVVTDAITIHRADDQ